MNRRKEKKKYKMKDKKQLFACNNLECGECKVCKYNDFIDWAEGCCPSDMGCTIQRDLQIEIYLKNRVYNKLNK